MIRADLAVDHPAAQYTGIVHEGTCAIMSPPSFILENHGLTGFNAAGDWRVSRDEFQAISVIAAREGV
jgi:hypothetical protein